MKAIFSAAVLLVVSVTLAGAQETRPRILAFVIGIERYNDAELDKLTFAADDAKAVYDQLRVIADLDPRSVLRVADDDERSSVMAAQLREALEAFVWQIDNEANVVVYLGGHGTLSPNGDLWFLPSDFDSSVQRNKVPFTEISRYFQDRVSWGKLHNVKITFLVNMCGAGNAVVEGDPNRRVMNVGHDPETMRAIQKALKELKLGVSNTALLPATPRNRNTFEDVQKKRSLYAYHLLDGLRGAAAKNGVITTGSLFDYLNARLGGELDRPDHFDSNIQIGVTRHLEGEASFHLGSALLAGARSIQSIESQGRSADSQELLAQATILEDLALMEFERVPARKPELAGRSMLRNGALHAATGRALPNQLFEQLRATSGLTLQEQEYVQHFSTEDAADIRFATLDLFLRHLMANEPYILLISYEAEEDLRVWFDFLNEISPSNLVRIQNDYPVKPAQSEALVSHIKPWRQENERRPVDQRRHLLVVYTGRARLSSPDSKDCYAVGPPKADCVLEPFGNDLVQQLADAWSGPLALFYDAPFGGYLLKAPPHGASPAMLFLAAAQPNGMTFSMAGKGQPECSTSQLIVRALRENVQNIHEFPPLLGCYEQFREQIGNERRRDYSWEVGRPAWIPAWGGPDLRFWTAEYLRPATRYSLQVVSGCTTQSFEECAKVVAAGFGERDPFERLVDAAKLDLAGRYESAADIYETIAQQFTMNNVAGSQSPLGMEASRRVFSTAAEAIARRASGSKVKQRRKVVVLPIAVEDYSSPLVADLPNAVADVKAYATAIEHYLTNRNTEVRIQNVVSPATTQEFLQLLRDTASMLDKQAGDLLVLVFSGRGLERDGRRYLALGSVNHLEKSATVQTSAPSAIQTLGQRWSRDALVDLWDIAEHMNEHWLVAIYDVQFTPSVLDPARIDQVLDKHLESVRPLPLQPRSAGDEAEVPGDHPGISIVRRGAVPPRQVHIWVEGRVTQDVQPRNLCSRVGTRFAGASPLATAVGSMLEKGVQGTFRDFAGELASDQCLRSRGERKSVALQGDVDVPFLASGDGAEYVDYFHDGLMLADINIRVAYQVAVEIGKQFPSARNHLAQAALLGALIQLHSKDPVRGLSQERDTWLYNAQTILEKLIPNELKTEGDEILLPIRFELLSRVFALRGDPHQALYILRWAEPSAVLTERNLARRLVNLTSEVVRLEPTEVLKNVGVRLEQLQANVGAVNSAKKDFDELLRAERARRAEPYSITKYRSP